MKKLLIIITLLTFTATSYAQEGEITIIQDNKIDELLTAYKNYNKRSGFYKIQIYFGRLSKANEIQKDANADFPGWPSEIHFEEPTYRVRIGKFKKRFDAERNLIKVKKKYPAAVLIKPQKTTK